MSDTKENHDTLARALKHIKVGSYDWAAVVKGECSFGASFDEALAKLTKLADVTKNEYSKIWVTPVGTKSKVCTLAEAKAFPDEKEPECYDFLKSQFDAGLSTFIFLTNPMVEAAFPSIGKFLVIVCKVGTDTSQVKLPLWCWKAGASVHVSNGQPLAKGSIRSKYMQLSKEVLKQKAQIEELIAEKKDMQTQINDLQAQLQQLKSSNCKGRGNILCTYCRDSETGWSSGFCDECDDGFVPCPRCCLESINDDDND